MTRQKNQRYDEAVGARLRGAMEAAKLSIPETAKKLGKSTGQIFRYFSGATHVEPADLARFAKLFKCKPGDFLDGIEVGK